MLAHVVCENNAQRGAEIENGSEWSNETVHFDRTGPTEKSGAPRDQKWADLFETFPVNWSESEIVVEWKAPFYTSSKLNRYK